MYESKYIALWRKQSFGNMCFSHMAIEKDGELWDVKRVCVGWTLTRTERSLLFTVLTQFRLTYNDKTRSLPKRILCSTNQDIKRYLLCLGTSKLSTRCHHDKLSFLLLKYTIFLKLWYLFVYTFSFTLSFSILFSLSSLLLSPTSNKTS